MYSPNPHGRPLSRVDGLNPSDMVTTGDAERVALPSARP